MNAAFGPGGAAPYLATTPPTARSSVDLTPGTVGADGQTVGCGCVYATGVKTVADELAAGGQVWKAYVEDIAAGGPGAASCRHPTPGAADPSQAPVAGDAYEPFSSASTA